MELHDQNDQQQFEQLLASETIEPRGWFRWLHNHYLGRYGGCHPELVAGDAFYDVWGKVSDKPEPMYIRIGTTEQWVEILNQNAWAAGMGGRLTYTVAKHWRMLRSEARSAFFAGLSELHPDEASMQKVPELLPVMSLAPESLCQLACNAIRYNKPDLLKALLTKYPSPTYAIKRFSAYDTPDAWETNELEKLSHRVIDLILEAALLWNNIAAAKLALEHGADPNIPIWQLERSYNKKYSALGYAIDTEFIYSRETHKAMIDLLLDNGASAAGIAYSGYNSELSLALAMRERDLVDRLISQGASLSKPEQREKRETVRTEGSESIVIGPGGPNFFGHFGRELKWAHENIGSIIPLVPVSEKQIFFSAHSQGGSYSTMMDKVVGDLAALKQYEELGLDTRLSAEELCTAVKVGAFDSLVYLLSKHGELARDRTMFRIRRFRPDIGATRRYLETVPQQDGVNSATNFDPYGQEYFALPDGSKLYVDLSAIAAPGHNLGACFKGYFWLRDDAVALRRHKDRIIARRFEQRWQMEPLPLRKPGNCKEQRYLDDCLPLIREIDGQFIHLGVTLGNVIWLLPKCELRNADTPWRNLPAYVSIQDQAEKLIKEQVVWNSLPEAPVLTTGELYGYPAEFWPYLIRLENGFIGMTVESCIDKPYMFREYRSWEWKAKKHERDFKPDPRLVEWEHWHEVPTDYKPYFYIDTMFRNRPAVISADYYDRYKYGMSEKVKNWLWNMEQKWK